MREFNRGGGDRGGRSDRGDRFGGQSRFGGSRGPRRDNDRFDRSDRPMMHQAVCAECGRDCEVPFKPTGDKPVLCSNCFGKQKDSFGSGRFERRESVRPSFDRSERRERPASSDQYREQFEMLNSKLDSILRLLNTKSAVVKESKTEAVEEKPAKKVATKKEPTKKAVAKKTVKPAKKATTKKK